MIRLLCFSSLLILGCASTSTPPGSGAAQQGKAAFISNVRGEDSIPGIFRSKADLDIAVTSYLILPMARIAENAIHCSNQFSRLVAEAKISRFAELSGRPNTTDLCVYKLEECQSICVAIAIANRLPITLEIMPQNGKDSYCALFYHFKIVANNVRVGQSALSGDREQIYLEQNVGLINRYILMPSKGRIDNFNCPLSSDLLDPQEKIEFSLTFSTTRTQVNEDGSFHQVGYWNELSVDNLFLVAPRTMTAGDIEEMFSEGLGNRDFSYKPPKLTKLF